MKKRSSPQNTAKRLLKQINKYNKYIKLLQKWYNGHNCVAICICPCCEEYRLIFNKRR